MTRPIYNPRVTTDEEERAMDVIVGTEIDLTPTDAGYEHMAIMMLDNVLGDTRVARKTASAALLGSVLDIVRYFAAKGASQSPENPHAWSEAQEHLTHILKFLKERS